MVAWNITLGAITLANEFHRYYVEKIEKIGKAIPVSNENVIDTIVYNGTKFSTLVVKNKSVIYLVGKKINR